ncbi:hypothetical protein MJD09_18835 [bacterium]|nr:hypothetical protein [bacterium]
MEQWANRFPQRRRAPGTWVSFVQFQSQLQNEKRKLPTNSLKRIGQYLFFGLIFCLVFGNNQEVVKKLRTSVWFSVERRELPVALV